MRPFIATPSKKAQTKYSYLVPLLSVSKEGKRAGNPYRYFTSAQAAVKCSQDLPSLGVFYKADNKVIVNDLYCFVWFQIL